MANTKPKKLTKEKKRESHKAEKKAAKENSISVFIVKPESGSSRIVTKRLGNIDIRKGAPKESLINQYNLNEVRDHQITASIYTSQFPGEYLKDHTTLPVMTVLLSYSYKMVMGSIGGFTLSIDIPEEEKKDSDGNLLSIMQYTNRTFYGEYNIRFSFATKELQDKFAKQQEKINKLIEKNCSIKFETYNKVYKTYISSIINSDEFQELLGKILDDAIETRMNMLGASMNDDQRFADMVAKDIPYRLEDIDENDLDELVSG